jgi:hypothetical protein
VRSDGPEGIACWFIDTDYNEESFFVRHAYFLGANDPYKAAARFNYDIDAIVRHIQSVEAASGRTYVQPPQSSNAATDGAPGEGRGADEA